MFFLCVLAGQSIAFAEDDFLSPEQAFRFTSKQISRDKIEVTFHIADGYYMYRDRFKVSATGAKTGNLILPAGAIKFDETFQKNMETFHKLVSFQIPILSVDQSLPQFTLITQSQGCSEQGLCYVPMDSAQKFDTAQFIAEGNAVVNSSSGVASHDAGLLTSSLRSGSLLIITPLFFLMGLGLAFTPCVLPMVPILSTIILGEGAGVNGYRGLVLSLAYSFGMALVYTALGIAAGLLGEGLAGFLQSPWVLGAFALLLIALALSMFNVYHLQVPALLHEKLNQFSGRHRSGKLFGVFMMGAISALIVGPCVAAPLASALLYISQTHNVVIGGAALFAMAIGMSVPLIVIGVSGGSLLPRAGKWMESVKYFFGVLILATALWMVSPVLPVWLRMVGWSILLIGSSVFLFRHNAITLRVVASILLMFGLIELVGVSTGGREVLAPLAHFSHNQKSHVKFTRIKTLAELGQALAQAKAQARPVMLDFYADWCVACVEMEKYTFSDDRVKNQLAGMTLLQVDVTSNNKDDRELLKHFNLYGPPGIIFFGSDSKESGRVIGFEKADKFLSSLTKSLPISRLP